jgi:HNH endonuclease
VNTYRQTEIERDRARLNRNRELGPYCEELRSYCHLFTGLRRTPHTDKNGRPSDYGVFKLNGRSTSAHQASFRLYYPWCYLGLPEGFEVHHKCRVRRCINPAHLELMTRVENMRANYI